MTRLRSPRSLLYALFFLSGGAGLGYQVVWTRMFAAGLGHELAAVLAVLCAFMGGMAVGAWALDRTVSRSARPGKWYGALELTIGVWGFVSPALIPLANQVSAGLIGIDPSPLRHWAVAFTLPFLVLLPATAGMGATLPAMERFLAPLSKDARCLGGLYAANALGAVIGILAGTFVLAPALGFRQTAWVLAGTNLVCGLVALRFGARSFTPAAASEKPGARILDSMPAMETLSRGRGRPRPSTVPPLSRRRLLTTLFFTGLLGIGYETLGVRVLSQVLENTIYTYAAALSIFLLGTALGAGLYQRFGRRYDPERLLTDLLLGLTLSCLLGVLAFSQAQQFYDFSRALFGDGPIAVPAAEMAVALSVFALPTPLMGATFSHLAQAARGPEGGVGRAGAANTLGAASAPWIFGVVLLAHAGPKWALVVLSLAYLILAPNLTGWRWSLVGASLALVAVLPSKLQFVQIPPGGHLAAYRDGAMASVAVVEDASRARTLRVNNRFQMGGTAAAAAEYRHAHLPLLLHPQPRRALFLGLGTGITLGAACLYSSLQSDGVELVPEVVEMMDRFEPHNFSPRRHPQLKIHVADARRFVRVTSERYDVVVADLFHPARDGAGALYTLEHFAAIRQRLQPDGLFCQWLPLYQLDRDVLQVITRTFLEVFPQAQAWLLWFNVDTPVLGLVGLLQSPRYADQWVERRLDGGALEAHLKQLALADSVRFFGGLLAGPEALRHLANEAPLNTDDRPRVTFAAPRFSWQRKATPYGRLMGLLELGLPDPRTVLGLESDEAGLAFGRRLSDYMRARNVYLHGLVAQAEDRSDRAFDLFVESARLSSDFTSGYAQCLSLASLQAQSRPAEARNLLERLIEAQPANPVARELLDRLFGPPAPTP